MWWLIAIFAGVFMAWGFNRPHYTHYTYVDNNVDCDGGGGCDYDSGDSYSDGGCDD